MKQTIEWAVFPVAGLGTRVLPATKSIAKEMLPLLDKPLIQYAVEEARAAGIERFCFVSSLEKKAIEAHFLPAFRLEALLQKKGKIEALNSVTEATLPDGALTMVYQAQALGLGHAIGCARHVVGDAPFAVFLPDDVVISKRPCIAQMIDAWQQGDGGAMVAVEEVDQKSASNYGVIDPDQRLGRVIKVKGLVEKPKPESAPSNLAIIGRYILPSSIFDEIDALKFGAGGEMQITDALVSLLYKHHNVSAYAFEGVRYDCGSVAGLLRATLELAKQNPAYASIVRDCLGGSVAGSVEV